MIKLLNIGKSTFWQMLTQGRLPPGRYWPEGKARVWWESEVKAFINGEGNDTNTGTTESDGNSRR
jgi:predicted DNA-binding transcriptional regulator AlpA